MRDLVPIRPLSRTEAYAIAELQATKLLALTDAGEPPVPGEVVSELPRIEVVRRWPMFGSGSSEWSRGRWLISINSREAWTRQRFTLAHEFKHILDHPFIGLLHSDLSGEERQQQIEWVCNYFAACLLMPRAWVKRVYCDERTQDLRRLARRFGVSQEAMNRRLLDIGLIEPQPRCTPYRREASERFLMEWATPEGVAA